MALVKRAALRLAPAPPPAAQAAARTARPPRAAAAPRRASPRPRGPRAARSRPGPATGPRPNLSASATRRSGWRDVAQLAGQADLAEAGERLAAAAQRLAAMRRGDRERDGEVGAGLVDPDAAGDVDEDVGGRGRDAGVAGEHGEHHREPVAVDARRGAARRHDLGRRDERLDLDEQRPGALHRAEHARARRPRVASSTKRAEGSATSARPPERISNSRSRSSSRSGS